MPAPAKPPAVVAHGNGATITTTATIVTDAAAPDDQPLPTISWGEHQRRVTEGGELLILVAGSVIDVAELQEGEHKGASPRTQPSSWCCVSSFGLPDCLRRVVALTDSD